MGVIATALKHLIAAGMTGDDLVRAVADLEDATPQKDAAAEKRRAWDRERRREERAAARLSTGHPPESADKADTPSLEVSPQTPLPNPTQIINPEPARTRKAGPFPCPAGVDPQHWSDFLANRQRKRLANTPTAYRGVLARIAEFSDENWPPGRIVEFAAERGWGGIFDPRGRDDGHEHRNGKHQADDGGSPTARALERWYHGSA